MVADVNRELVAGTVSELETLSADELAEVLGDGEAFGVHVRCGGLQVATESTLPRKGGIPLPDVVAVAVAEHLRRHPAVEVTLRWGDRDGPPCTAELVVTSRQSSAVDRN